MNIQRHTHTSTHEQSAHKRNVDNQAQEPGWEGRKKGFVKNLAHTHKITKNVKNKPIFTNLKNRFEHKELPAKLLDYFLWSNKSNINQSELYYMYIKILHRHGHNQKNTSLKFYWEWDLEGEVWTLINQVGTHTNDIGTHTNDTT